jgi:hypothetical protein
VGFTDPNTVHNPSTGGVAPASWGDTVRDDLVWLNDPDRVKVTKSANQTLTTATTTLLTWDTETWDSNGLHSTAVNTDRLTCVTAGRYLVIAHIVFAVDAGGAGYRALEVWKNSSAGTWIAGDTVPSPGTATYSVLNVVAEVSLTATDYVSCYGYQNSGGNLDVRSGTGSWSSWFEMRCISA